jgi:hypothetical protein
MIKCSILVVSLCLTVLLISSCSDGTTTTSGVDKNSNVYEKTATTFTEYVQNYPDLLAAYSAGSSESIEAWGKTHYCTFGKKEGRAYSGSESCSSSSSYTANQFAEYVNKYADLLAAYNASGGHQSKGTWGKSHYENYGEKEGRTIPDSSSGKKDGKSASSLIAGDYQYLCKHNECSTFSNRTTRWASKTINVYSHYPALYTGLQGNWPVTFNLGATGGITIRYGFGRWCGVAYPVKYRDGTIRQCLILINVRHDELSCGSQISTVIHELGHCIGFFGHTTDGGIMDATANGAAGTNATVRNMISLLYSLPPGTDISSRMRSYSRKGGDKYQPNNAQMRPIKAYYRNSRH